MLRRTIGSIGASLQHRVQDNALRRQARPQAASATRSGAQAELRGNVLRAKTVSNGVLIAGQPVIVSADSGIVQQEHRNLRRAEDNRRPLLKTGKVQVFVTWTENGVVNFGWGGTSQTFRLIPLQIPVSEYVVDTAISKFGRGLDDWILSVKVRLNNSFLTPVKIYTIQGGQESPTMSQATYNYQTLGHRGFGLWVSSADIYYDGGFTNSTLEYNNRTQSGIFLDRRYSGAVICTALGTESSYVEYCVSGFIGQQGNGLPANEQLESLITETPYTGFNTFATRVATNLGLNGSRRREYARSESKDWITTPGNNYGSIPYGSPCDGPAADLVIEEGQWRSSQDETESQIQKLEHARIALWSGAETVGISEEVISSEEIGSSRYREPSGSKKIYNSACQQNPFNAAEKKLVPIFASFTPTGATDVGGNTSTGTDTYLNKNAYPSFLGPNLFHAGFKTVTRIDQYQNGNLLNRTFQYEADIRAGIGVYDALSYSYDRTIHPSANNPALQTKRYVVAGVQQREIANSDLSYSKWGCANNKQFLFDEDWEIREVIFDGDLFDVENGGKHTIKVLKSVAGGAFVQEESKASSLKISVPTSNPIGYVGSFWVG